MATANGQIALRKLSGTEVWALLYDYDVGKVALKAAHKRLLINLAPLLGSFQRITVRVEGHASQTGSEPLNQNLSEMRAATVLAYLRYRAPHDTSLAVGRASSGEITMVFRAPPRYDVTAMGERNLVSRNRALRNRVPPGPSHREDDRDRSVIVKVSWKDRGVRIDPRDWDAAFETASVLAGVDAWVMSGGAMSMTNPGAASGLAAAATDLAVASASGSSPTGDEIGRIMKEQTVQRMMYAVHQQGLPVTREEVSRRYDEWANRASVSHR